MRKILVVGNGIAGLFAALRIRELGGLPILVSQAEPMRSQSVLAAGGINAALDSKGEGDSIELHSAETLSAACGIGEKEGIKAMVTAAPYIIEYLGDLGTLFSRDDRGSVDLRSFGGQSKKRTVFARSGIGRQIMCALVQELQKQERQGKIVSINDLCFSEAIIEEGACLGGVFRHKPTGQEIKIHADATIVAVGGLNGLFGSNATGSTLSDGRAAAALFSQGVRFQNLEMIQYHPTSIKAAGKNILISEAARGEGGRLFAYREGKPWYFMEEQYPKKGNLEARDIVSRGIYKAMQVSDDGKVYLDIRLLGEELIEDKLKEVKDMCLTYLGIDPAKEPIPVEPAVHYFMGGIKVNGKHESSIRGLYAAGECVGRYHGANRLGGNSLLGATFGGLIAGTAAMGVSNAECIGKAQKGSVQQQKPNCGQEAHCLETIGTKEDTFLIADSTKKYLEPCREQRQLQKKIQKIMCDGLGIERSGQKLKECIDRLTLVLDEAKNRGYAETEKITFLAMAMVGSANEREESRGAHYRTDYPLRDDENYMKSTVTEFADNKIRISLEDAE